MARSIGYRPSPSRHAAPCLCASKSIATMTAAVGFGFAHAMCSGSIPRQSWTRQAIGLRSSSSRTKLSISSLSVAQMTCNACVRQISNAKSAPDS
eukprot:3939816-Rhodomonas_salina.4